MNPNAVVARIAIRAAARSMVLMGAFMTVAVVAIANSYRSLYVTPTDRSAVAALIQGNRAFESLFGAARGLDTVEGFTAWRAGTPVLVVVAVVGFLAATRLLRGEEDAGRWETVVAGGISAAWATTATLAALVGLLAAPALMAGAAFLAADASVAQASAQAAALWAHGAIFVAIGAVASQAVAPRRRAAGAAALVMGIAFLIRVVADGVAGWGWLRALTPFGWAEEAQPLEAVRWGWILLPVVLGTVLASIAVLGARSRDLGAGWIGYGDRWRSSPTLLGSAQGYVLRSSLRPTLVWVLATTAMATVLGLLAADIVAFLTVSDAFARFASKIGPGFRLSGAEAFLGMAVTFLAIPVALAGVYRIVAAREEEATGRLDASLAGSTRRVAWMLTCAGTALAVAAVVAVVAVTTAFGVAALRGADVDVADGGFAALNTLPAAAAFVGVAVLLFGIVPRRAAAVSLGFVGVAELVALLGAQEALPAWLRDLSPFAHVRPVPSVPADVRGATAMLAVGLVAALIGTVAFLRRDVVRD